MFKFLYRQRAAVRESPGVCALAVGWCGEREVHGEHHPAL
jgi:hypothetical protein